MLEGRGGGKGPGPAPHPGLRLWAEASWTPPAPTTRSQGPCRTSSQDSGGGPAPQPRHVAMLQGASGTFQSSQPQVPRSQPCPESTWAPDAPDAPLQGSPSPPCCCPGAQGQPLTQASTGHLDFPDETPAVQKPTWHTATRCGGSGATTGRCQVASPGHGPLPLRPVCCHGYHTPLPPWGSPPTPPRSWQPASTAGPWVQPCLTWASVSSWVRSWPHTPKACRSSFPEAGEGEGRRGVCEGR